MIRKKGGSTIRMGKSWKIRPSHLSTYRNTKDQDPGKDPKNDVPKEMDLPFHF
jgi:hypothetical protein